MPDIFTEAVHGFEHLFHGHHGQSQAPTGHPASLEPQPQKETTMSLAAIADDIKGAIENADQWVKQVTETHLPAILAVAAKYESDPIVQALEGFILPPDVAAELAGIVKRYAQAFGQPAAPAEPVAPAPAQ